MKLACANGKQPGGINNPNILLLVGLSFIIKLSQWSEARACDSKFFTEHCQWQLGRWLVLGSRMLASHDQRARQRLDQRLDQRLEKCLTKINDWISHHQYTPSFSEEPSTVPFEGGLGVLGRMPQAPILLFWAFKRYYLQPAPA